MYRAKFASVTAPSLTFHYSTRIKLCSFNVHLLTNYTLSFISRNPEAIDTLYDLYFHFCHKLALETLAKCSSIKPVRVHDLCHAHSLAGLQWSGLSDQRMLLPTENCLQWQKWSSYKGGGAFLCPTSANQGFLIASQGSCHVHDTPC